MPMRPGMPAKDMPMRPEQMERKRKRGGKGKK